MTEQETSVIEEVLLSNRILEAFGNARTIRNDYSSNLGNSSSFIFLPLANLSVHRSNIFLGEASSGISSGD